MIWTPSDTRSTCGLPPFRLLDYAVISPSFQVLARSMTAIHDLPWHAHLVLEITLTREAKVFRCQELALPRPFDQPAAVKTKPDQSSKRSRRKAAFLNLVSKSQERRAAGPSAQEEGDGSALLRSLPEDTRDRIWHTIHSASDFESPPVPAHVLASQAYAFNPQESSSLGRLWGRWAATMEKFFCLDLRVPTHEWPRFTGRGLGAQTRSTTWGRCKPPRFSRHGLASGWWGAVSKYLLLYLTCSQRNHGDAQQQAACAALRARAQSVPPSLDTDAEHEALWGFRLSDICSIAHPVLWGMYREATDRTHNLRAKAISEARRGIDDWVRQHAEKGNKRLHAWYEGTRPLQWNSRSTVTQPLTPHVFWLPSVSFGPTFGHLERMGQSTIAPFSRCATQRRNKSLCPPSRPPCWIQLSVLHDAMQARDTTCWDQPTSSPFRNGVGAIFASSSTISRRLAPGPGNY